MRRNTRRLRIDDLILALVLIRVGQELGSGGRLAVAVRALIDALLILR